MLKKIVLSMFISGCFSMVYAQKAKPKPPKSIKVANATVINLDNVPPPPPPPKIAKPTEIMLDSAQMDALARESFCAMMDSAIHTARLDNITAYVLVSMAWTMDDIAEKKPESSQNWMEKELKMELDNLTPQMLEATTRFFLYRYANTCPAFDSLLRYDGLQRPAYAHLTKQGCNCINGKMAQFADQDLARLKFDFMRDSCFKEIFKDENNLKIVFEANDFKTRAAVDSFDNNFGGYFFKNCKACFEQVMYLAKAGIDEHIKTKNAFLPSSDNQSATLYDLRNRAIQGIVSKIWQLSSDVKYAADEFKHNEAYQNSVVALKSAAALLRPQKVADYLIDKAQRSDGVSEIRLTFYKFNVKTQRKDILCQTVFEFEEQDEKVAVFRFIPKSQISNLAKLEQRLLER